MDVELDGCPNALCPNMFAGAEGWPNADLPNTDEVEVAPNGFVFVFPNADAPLVGAVLLAPLPKAAVDVEPKAVVVALPPPKAEVGAVFVTMEDCFLACSKAC